MKNTPPTELNTEQLIKKKKTTGIITGSLAGVLIILLVQSLYVWATEGFTTSALIPLALCPEQRNDIIKAMPR